uniref:Uncharacterized protein n=1 Tax=Romanomermis culicivorax TaxID=13658 RepID=A0A915L8Q9_ROMCU
MPKGQGNLALALIFAPVGTNNRNPLLLFYVLQIYFDNVPLCRPKQFDRDFDGLGLCPPFLIEKTAPAYLTRISLPYSCVMGFFPGNRSIDCTEAGRDSFFLFLMLRSAEYGGFRGKSMTSVDDDWLSLWMRSNSKLRPRIDLPFLSAIFLLFRCGADCTSNDICFFIIFIICLFMRVADERTLPSTPPPLPSTIAAFFDVGDATREDAWLILL